MGLFDGTPLERPVTCPRCEKPLADCRCPRDAAGNIKTPADQPLRVRRETGGRGGKTVTVILGLDPDATDLAALLKELKNALGTGGTIKQPEGLPRADAHPAKGPARSSAAAGPVKPGKLGPNAPLAGPTLELQGDHRDRVLEILRALGYPAKSAGG